MLSIQDLKKWNIKTYTLLQVSYLFWDDPPPDFHIKKTNKKHSFPSDIYDVNISQEARRVFFSFISLIKKGEIPLSESFMDIIREMSVPLDVIFQVVDVWLDQGCLLDVSELLRLDRCDLIDLFSRNANQPKPAFLFEANAPLLLLEHVEMPVEAIEHTVYPLPTWLDRRTLTDIQDLWDEFLKRQNGYVLKELKDYGKITKANITKPDLKKLLLTAHQAIKSPIDTAIIKNLGAKYTDSREKEGFFCDIVGKLAKNADDREFSSLRKDLMYKKILGFLKL
jgi:hypothetical protein